MFIHVSNDLEDLNFDQFLKTGFILSPPGEEFLWLGVAKKGSREDHCFFHVNFYNKVQSFIQSDCVFKVGVDKFRQFLRGKFNDLALISHQKNNDEAYFLDVEGSLREFKKQEQLKKLVCVTKANYSLNNIHPISRFDGLVKLQGSLYGVWGMETKNVIGVSPEPLLIRKKNFVETLALAGTISVGEADFEKTILNDAKELEEHNLVVQDIISKVEDCAKDIQKGDVAIKRFGTMAHLETHISFETTIETLDLVVKLSPTAALGGYPTELVSRELQKHHYFQEEKFLRSFGGVYGIRSAELEVALVGIRNLYWENGQAEIHSGSGIVAGSEPSKEVSEVQKKRESIEGIFNES